MKRVLIVNADDFGLSKGQNYGIVEAYRNGVVTSTTALVNGEAIDHAAQLSHGLPALGVGMHFVLTLGKPVSEMPGLTRDGLLGKWIWQMAEEDTLPLDEIAHELACQYQRFIELFGREPTHLDSHHHVHMFSPSPPALRRSAGLRYVLTVRRCLTQAICRQICAVRRDLVVSFTARKSPKRAFYTFWILRRIEEKVRWK